MNSKNQESKYAKINNQEYALSVIALPLSLTRTVNEAINQMYGSNSKHTNNSTILTSVSLKSDPLPTSLTDTFLYSWKSNTEQFKLLMDIKHNNNGFLWCDPALLSQNLDILNKLDFMQLEKPRIKHNKPNINAYETKNLVMKPNFISNLVLKRKTKRPTSKNTIKKSFKQAQLKQRNLSHTHLPRPSSHEVNNAENNTREKMNSYKKAVESNSSSSIQLNLVNNSIQEQAKNLTDQADESLIYNLQMINANSVSTFLPSIEITPNSHSSIANCTYYNLMPISVASNNYYQHNDINTPVMVETNVESSDFSELLNCLRGESEISIENDNMFIFNSKF